MFHTWRLHSNCKCINFILAQSTTTAKHILQIQNTVFGDALKSLTEQLNTGQALQGGGQSPQLFCTSCMFRMFSKTFKLDNFSVKSSSSCEDLGPADPFWTQMCQFLAMIQKP